MYYTLVFCNHFWYWKFPKQACFFSKDFGSLFSNLVKFVLEKITMSGNKALTIRHHVQHWRKNYFRAWLSGGILRYMSASASHNWRWCTKVFFLFCSIIDLTFKSFKNTSRLMVQNTFTQIILNVPKMFYRGLRNNVHQSQNSKKYPKK